VLNYVREKEPISRAAIAREMALQRSTVSEIVESLTAEGLIEEIGEASQRVVGGLRPAAAVCGRDGYRSKYHPDLHYTVATSDLGAGW